MFSFVMMIDSIILSTVAVAMILQFSTCQTFRRKVGNSILILITRIRYHSFLVKNTFSLAFNSKIISWRLYKIL